MSSVPVPFKVMRPSGFRVPLVIQPVMLEILRLLARGMDLTAIDPGSQVGAAS
jgi:hypothetical protein